VEDSSLLGLLGLRIFEATGSSIEDTTAREQGDSEA